MFQALSQRLSERMLADAAAARHQSAATADKLAAMSTAWFGTYVETIWNSPHAAELMDAKHRLSADQVARATSQFKRLVRDVIAEAAAAGELDLEQAGLTSDDVAELLIASGRGLQSSAASPAAYRQYLEALVRIMIAGLRSTAAGRPASVSSRSERNR